MGGSSSCTVRKDFLGMLKSQMWGNSWLAEFLLADLIHAVFIYCLFRIDASPKRLFVSCHYHVLFVCLALKMFKVNTTNIFLDIQIMQDPLSTAVLTTIFFRDYFISGLKEFIPQIFFWGGLVFLSKKSKR